MSNYRICSSYIGRRKCRTCRKELPVEDFIRNWPHCTSCIIEHEEEWIKLHRRSLIEYLNQYREE